MNHKLVATFTNERGKQHNWTYKGIDTDLPAETIKEACELLTSLDIFERDGVKLFDSVVTAKIVTTIEHKMFDRRSASTEEPTTEPSVSAEGTDVVDTSEEQAASETPAAKGPVFSTVMGANSPIRQTSLIVPAPPIGNEHLASGTSQMPPPVAVEQAPSRQQSEPPPSPSRSRKGLLSRLLHKKQRE
nr:DUF2922 domain-containing protein [uncultured Enterococcus sp.]